MASNPDRAPGPSIFVRHGATVAALLFVACGTDAGPIGYPAGTEAGAPGQGPSSPGSFANGSDAGSCAANPGAGCPCSPPGQTAACWTGPPDKRNVGMCHDGTQQCASHGEFSTWGPCQGEELNCGGTGGTGSEDAGGVGTGGGGNEDSGGPPTGGGGGEDAGCACVPGATIWCDEDCNLNVYCSLSAQKTCLPDGTWGPCMETNLTNPDPFGGLGNSGPCEEVGVGCASCNNGAGYYLGNCTQQLRCMPPQVTCTSIMAQGNGQGGTVTCVCN
jgi:hypothetical protein